VPARFRFASSHKVPGAIWSLGKTLEDDDVRKSA